MADIARAAAVYARISLDQEGTALGVARQVKDCRKLAESLGWVVAEEYVDNDASAYSGRTRPAYERMLADLVDGRRDAVLVYHADRLTRRPIELEQFVEVVASAGVTKVRFVAGGPIDVANGDGLLVLRMLAAVAANESSSKSRRIKRKLEENAASGLPHGGPGRPFGYELDKVTIRPDEAEVVRALVARYLAGESLRSLTVWLDDEGVRTVNGKTWRSTTLRQMLRSGRIAGLREHRGQVVGPASWPGIISESDHARVVAHGDANAANKKRSPRRYLLPGLVYCGRCGTKLHSATRKADARYVCPGQPDYTGCARITVVARPLEELVASAVLYRLDTADLADTLAGRASKETAGATLVDSVSLDRAQLDELAQLYSARSITAREWMTARTPIETRIKDNEARLSRITRTDALAGFVGNGEQLRVQWADLNLTRQHAIVSALVDRVTVNPSTVVGLQYFDHNRVDITWRL